MSWFTSELRVRLAPWNLFKPSSKIFLLTVPRRYFFCGSFAFFCVLCFSNFPVCSLLPCGHLLGKGWPLGSCWWCLLYFCYFPMWYSRSVYRSLIFAVFLTLKNTVITLFPPFTTNVVCLLICWYTSVAECKQYELRSDCSSGFVVFAWKGVHLIIWSRHDKLTIFQDKNVGTIRVKPLK